MVSICSSYFDVKNLSKIILIDKPKTVKFVEFGVMFLIVEEWFQNLSEYILIDRYWAIFLPTESEQKYMDSQNQSKNIAIGCIWETVLIVRILTEKSHLMSVIFLLSDIEQKYLI